MSKRGDAEYLQDIKEAVLRILEYCKDLSYESFMKDSRTQDAVVRNLEIIGEAVKNLSQALTEQHQQIAWKDISKMRDKLIHHYFGVNFDIVWGIV